MIIFQLLKICHPNTDLEIGRWTDKLYCRRKWAGFWLVRLVSVLMSFHWLLPTFFHHCSLHKFFFLSIWVLHQHNLFLSLVLSASDLPHWLLPRKNNQNLVSRSVLKPHCKKNTGRQAVLYTGWRSLHSFWCLYKLLSLDISWFLLLDLLLFWNFFPRFLKNTKGFTHVN